MPSREPEQIAVFEVLNSALREIYVGTTDLPLPQLAAEYKKKFPAALSHWRQEHIISYDFLDESILPTDAPVFLAAYARSMSSYKVITESNQLV